MIRYYTAVVYGTVLHNSHPSSLKKEADVADKKKKTLELKLKENSDEKIII